MNKLITIRKAQGNWTVRAGGAVLGESTNALELSEQELAQLPRLIAARLVSSVLITSHMAVLHPQNRDYLLIDTRSAAAGLAQLLDFDLDALADGFARSYRASDT